MDNNTQKTNPNPYYFPPCSYGIRTVTSETDLDSFQFADHLYLILHTFFKYKLLKCKCLSKLFLIVSYKIAIIL